MKIRRWNRRGEKSAGGGALVAALVAGMVLLSMSGAMLAAVTITERSRAAAIDLQKARAVARSGVGHAVVRLHAGVSDDLGSAEALVPFGEGGYWVRLQALDEGVFAVTALGRVRREEVAVRAVVRRLEGGVFANAIFAGNRTEDPLYELELGGTGGQADAILGDVYSGGHALLKGSASVVGTVRARGEVKGVLGEGEVDQPIPDIDAMDYGRTADVDVAELFKGAAWEEDNSGGYAWQLPEQSPAHIFRKNPSDRSGENASTPQDDYYLEDPYAKVSADYAQDGSSASELTLSGVSGEPGPSGNGKVYFIDGNLWLHNKKTYSFKFAHSEPQGVQVTFVVKGNIYFSDNLFYGDSQKDGVAFIAIADEEVADSGNIYLGDPEFGTLRSMQSFLYADRDFYDINLDPTGSAIVRLDGVMSAGNQVRIDRDWGDGILTPTQHTKLIVNYDDRVATRAITIPRLPPLSGVDDEVYEVTGWARTAVQLVAEGGD